MYIRTVICIQQFKNVVEFEGGNSFIYFCPLLQVMSLPRRVDGREQQIALQQQQSFLPLRGGFQDHFVMPPEPKYCCEHCRMVLCNPRQTECGHRFCESCINQLLRLEHL